VYIEDQKLLPWDNSSCWFLVISKVKKKRSKTRNHYATLVEFQLCKSHYKVLKRRSKVLFVVRMTSSKCNLSLDWSTRIADRIPIRWNLLIGIPSLCLQSVWKKIIALKQDFVSRSKLSILSIFIYISTGKEISSSRFIWD